MKKIFVSIIPAIIVISAAFPSFADDKKPIAARQVFAFWDKYLGLPANLRDGFAMLYVVHSRGGSVPDLMIVNGNRRTRVAIDREGVILNPPDLATWRTATVERANANTNTPLGISVTLDMKPIIPLSQNIQVNSINNALSDYKEAIRLTAGPAALIAPKLESVIFKGATAGFAVFQDGRRVQLRPQDGGLIFTPNKREMRNITSVSFNSTPTSVEFAK